MSKSNIEWTDYTWNPIVGCSKISAGCKNCYAEKLAWRLVCMNQNHYIPVVRNVGYGNKTHDWTGETAFVESALEKPLHWKKPRKIFVCSMGDLFHESVPFEWIDKVMAVIALCPQHTFLVLTKRPERMKEYFIEPIGGLTRRNYITSAISHQTFRSEVEHWNLNHLWLGVTTENQEQADKRIPILLQIPAAKRFVSVEPMLSEVDIRRYMLSDYDKAAHDHQMTGMECQTNKLNWVICGGETGSKARECKVDWVRDLMVQCEVARVPFFFKKFKDGETKIDGKEIREYPEVAK